MPQTGILTLNTKILGFACDKKEPDEKIRKHKTFVISKVLFHELFGNLKSSFNKICKGNKILSANCFKDEIEGVFRFLPDENNENLFKDIRELDIFEIIDSTGDSGYFLEFFFGKIDGEYTLDILDELENKINLGILLNSKLWHKGMEIIREFLQLKKYLISKGIISIFNESNDIYAQIDEMKEIIKNNEKNSDKTNSFFQQKINHNSFNENHFELLNQNNKEKKKKKPSKYKKANNNNRKTISINSLIEEAFNPFNFDKVLQLQKLYPTLFRKK